MPYFTLTSFHVQTSDHCGVDASGIIFKVLRDATCFWQNLFKAMKDMTFQKKLNCKKFLLTQLLTQV
jgi:hypothetical protein